MSKEQDNKNQWVKASNGYVPPGALEGGYDNSGEIIYVARASHEDDLIPGKLVPSMGCAFVSWNGKEIEKHDYEVLVNGSRNWRSTSGSNTPPGALIGGHTRSGENLFVGRVRHLGSLTTGKIQESHGVCYIPYGGKELRFSYYNVLIY